MKQSTLRSQNWEAFRFALNLNLKWERKKMRIFRVEKRDLPSHEVNPLSNKNHNHNGDLGPLNTFRSAFLDHRGEQWIVRRTNFLNLSDLREHRSRFEREDDC
jgi:hypothetical protein